MTISKPARRNSRRRELTGVRFGDLTVIGPAERGTNGKSGRLWKCVCKCGKEVVQPTVDLTCDRVTGCGCRRRKHAMTHTPEYLAWRHIKSRCFRPTCPQYKFYGSRGITMCDRWRNSFVVFFADVGPRPSDKHSIDRIDNDGNYEPGNCRWATKAQQSRNTRQNVFVEFNGERLTLRDWSKRLGMGFGTFRTRVKKWGVERAITTPIFTECIKKSARPKPR